jgi:prepilin peptidase CpaA
MRFMSKRTLHQQKVLLVALSGRTIIDPCTGAEMINLSRDILFTSAAVACAAFASIHDVKERRIPNLLTGPAIMIALALHFFAGGWKETIAAMLASLLAGGLLLIFFLAGGLGAGDVKLMAAVGCFAGLHALPTVLFTTAVSGAIFGLTLAIRGGRLREIILNAITIIRHHHEKGLVPHQDLNIDNEAALRMPFALPITAGCLITAGMQMWRL